MQLTAALTLAFFATLVTAFPLGNKCNPCEDFCPEYLQHPSSGNISCPLTPSDKDYCKGVNATDSISLYLCGNHLLGPLTLPDMVPVSSLVNSYDRLGGLCPAAFLGNWTVNGKSFIYPEKTRGYVSDVKCNPIKGVVKLMVGTLLDRFGSENGTFLSPKGAPYVERALPPSSLDNNRTAPKDHPNGYHVYEVVKEFEVYEGPITAWFGQPGGGSQFEIMELPGRKYNNITLLLGNTTGGPFLVSRN
ncbi:hypothetical protein BC835DRAFT_1418434 [Cytidiella melzeri]|nr:hypothetical protein BC835DRAFT_1418434 [Cytidiella melzeri]